LTTTTYYYLLLLTTTHYYYLLLRTTTYYYVLLRTTTYYRMLFFEALEQSGLTYVAVDPPPDEAQAVADGEAEPLTELFPEMRCYVFDIRSSTI